MRAPAAASTSGRRRRRGSSRASPASSVVADRRSTSGDDDSDAGADPDAVRGAVVADAGCAYLVGMCVASDRGGHRRLRRATTACGSARSTSSACPIGVLTQLVLVPLVYLPLREIWPDTFTDDQLSETRREPRRPGQRRRRWCCSSSWSCVGAPIVEELVYRGLLQRSFAARTSQVVAWLVAAAWFALIHFRPVEYPGLFVFGLVAGVCLMLTGRLGMSIVDPHRASTSPACCSSAMSCRAVTAAMRVTVTSRCMADVAMSERPTASGPATTEPIDAGRPADGEPTAPIDRGDASTPPTHRRRRSTSRTVDVGVARRRDGAAPRSSAVAAGRRRDRAPARRVGSRRGRPSASCASPSRAHAHHHDRRDDERRPPQPAEHRARPDLRQQHADRRRHGRPRLGPGVPPRPPAAALAAHRAGAWTGTPACPLYRFYMVVPALAIVALDTVLPYGVAFKLVAVSGSSRCRSAAGRSAGWPASATRCPSCSPSPGCASRSTRASASTAAT